MRKSNLGGSFVPYFVVAAIIVSSVFFITISAKQLILDYRYSNIIFLARDIQLGVEQSPKTLARYAEVSTTIAGDGVCRSDILRSGLSVLLHDLDMQNAQVDYDRWEAAIQSANIYLRHALTCMPMDGNLWLRYAMVSNEIAEQPDFIARLIGYSQTFAPAEAEILRSRIMFYNELTDKTLRSARSYVVADLVKALRYSPQMLKKMPVPPRKELEVYIKEAADRCGVICTEIKIAKQARLGGTKS